MEVCRTCLAVEVSKDLLDLPKGLEQESKTCEEILQFSVDIKIRPKQNISTKLCEHCFFKIIDIYKFKDQALRNQDFLVSRLKSENTKPSLLLSSRECKVDIHLDEIEIKDEINVKEEDHCREYDSEDTLLSDIKNVKYELVPEDVKENLPTLPLKKKRGRRKTVIIRSKEVVKEVCSICGKSFKNIKEHLACHLTSSERKMYPCEYCGKEFRGYSGRHRHMRIKHLGMKPHCSICNKDVVDLKTHTLTMHDASKLPFECNVCGRRFLNKPKIQQHMLSHTKEKPFPCDICQKGFSNLHLMQRHKREVHDKERQHLCQVCSKTFFKKYSLQEHLRSHTKEKPYECKTCGKWFQSTSSLRNHKQLHAADKNYHCKYCDMTFISSKYLDRHTLIHTKEKSYACKYCGVKFGRSDHRNRHQRTAHENHFPATVG